MENLLQHILKENSIENSKIVATALEKLAHNAKVYELSKTVSDLKSQILQIFNMYRETEEFRECHFSIPNAHVRKEYDFTFDLSPFPSIKITEIKNLDTAGLQFDAGKGRIYGIPAVANTLDLQIIFTHTGDENFHTDIKKIPFIINADPKDLWLNKPSPAGSRFPKEENTTFFSSFLDKKIVVASKRGRSHAHEGTFRDDDFLVKSLPGGWAAVAVADGAGSAKFARAGSGFATSEIVKSFDREAWLQDLSEGVIAYYAEEQKERIGSHEAPVTDIGTGTPGETSDVPADTAREDLSENTKIKSKSQIINALYQQVKSLHNGLVQFAADEGMNLKDLNTTLIFALVKKFGFGYVILSFGVGDCPINVIGRDPTEVQLLNFLDVGESSGATRFITMPEIFSRPDMAGRFAINCFTDFSKLFLMTDGIYDPKFVVESRLENPEAWKHFLRDLDGENEDRVKVDFEEDTEIEGQLSRWMDFWSKGNHDDRTLAIIY